MIKIVSAVAVLLVLACSAFGQTNKPGQVLGQGLTPGSPVKTCSYTNGVPVLCNGTGTGGAAAITMQHTYAAPGAFTWTHNLASLFFHVDCLVKNSNGTYSTATFSALPVDTNNASLTVPSAGTYICSFEAAPALVPDFELVTSPATISIQPSMANPQTAVFTDTQNAIGAYTSTASYSASGLATGMTGAFSPSTITGSGTNTFTVSFPPTQAASTTNITVQATDGTHTHTAPASLTIGNMNTGLVDGWSMTDGTGSAFANTAGTGNTETLGAGTLAWATNAPLPGSTATFSSTAYALGANQTATNFDGTTPFSFSTWVKISNLSTFRTVLSTLDATNKGWELGTNTGPVVFNVWLANAIGSNAIETLGSTVITANTLYFVVFTYDGSRTGAGCKLYLNGVAENATHPANNLTASTANANKLAIGGRPNGTFPLGGGIIAYTRLYNRALSPTDVAAYYAAGAR